MFRLPEKISEQMNNTHLILFGAVVRHNLVPRQNAHFTQSAVSRNSGV